MQRTQELVKLHHGDAVSTIQPVENYRTNNTVASTNNCKERKKKERERESDGVGMYRLKEI